MLNTILLFLTLLTPLPADPIEVGDTAKYQFRQPPVNSLGMTRLADFHGKPLLVEFYGHR